MSFITDLFGGKDKKTAPPAQPTPQVTDESEATTTKERARRVGRAALVASTQRGVLGNAPTGRRQLTAF